MTRALPPIGPIDQEGAVLRVEVHLSYEDALLLQCQPWGAIGIMIQAGDYDLVAGRRILPIARLNWKVSVVMLDRRRSRTRRRVQEVRHRLVGDRQHGVGLPAGPERAVGVGVAACQVAAHRVNHLLRHLRAAGTVKVDGWWPASLKQALGTVHAEVKGQGLAWLSLLGKVAAFPSYSQCRSAANRGVFLSRSRGV